MVLGVVELKSEYNEVFIRLVLFFFPKKFKKYIFWTLKKKGSGFHRFLRL
jgi:hypothetical protein